MNNRQRPITITYYKTRTNQSGLTRTIKHAHQKYCFAEAASFITRKNCQHGKYPHRQSSRQPAVGTKDANIAEAETMRGANGHTESVFTNLRAGQHRPSDHRLRLNRLSSRKTPLHRCGFLCLFVNPQGSPARASRRRSAPLLRLLFPIQHRGMVRTKLACALVTIRETYLRVALRLLSVCT